MLKRLLRKTSLQATRSPLTAPASRDSAIEIPRYPPFMKGLPVVPPEKLLDTQTDLLARIADTAIAARTDFERFYKPAIERFASFAHLLPASQSHHHRGAGGLLRHSLEVALWAMQSADKVLLDASAMPSARRALEPRWQFAVFAAALCHDAGKPVTDVAVVNRDRTATWPAISIALYEWATGAGIESYFLEWRNGRARTHTALSALIAQRIVGPEGFQWLAEGSVDLVVWVMESLAGNPGAANAIHDLVIKADQTSVERDLRSLGVAMAGYEIGVPVERHLTDIMRRFIHEGRWLVNAPGARVWNIGGHIYLVWPAAGQEIAKQLSEDGIPGIPRSPEGILDMLVERQIAFLREADSPAERLWKIAPDCLAEKIPDIALPAIRLRDDALISTAPIPAVSGKLVNGCESAKEKANLAPAPAQPADRPAEGDGGKQSQQTRQSAAPAGATPPPPHAAGTAQNDAPKPMSDAPSASAPARQQRSDEARPFRQERENAVKLDGAIGEALKALARDLKAGDKRIGKDVALDDDGCFLLRWPDAFSGYGLAPRFILHELSERDWLWTDPLTPLRKVQDRTIAGEQVKVAKLSREVSAILKREIDRDAPTQPQASAPCAPQPAAAGKAAAASDAQHARAAGERPEPADADAAPGEADAAARAGPDAMGKPSESAEPRPRPGQPANARELERGSIDEILRILSQLPSDDVGDGWRSVHKWQAVEACRKHGIVLTHRVLVELASRHRDVFALHGTTIHFCRPTQP